MQNRILFKKETINNKDTNESILIIKPGAIGDVLQMTPVVRAIKKKYPNSNILFLVGSQVASELLYNNPYINEVLIFKKGRDLKEAGRVLRFSRLLRRKKIFLILNYQPSNWRWRLMTFILRPQNVFLYKKQKRVKKGERLRHAVEDHLAVLPKFNFSKEDLHLDFFLTEGEKAEANEIINTYIKENGGRGEGIICINMGASHHVNRWPVCSFYRLTSILTTAGFKIILIGGSEDRILVDQFLSSGYSNCLDLVGQLSIRKTAAILSQCDLLVSGDTGPLHLATSVGTKVIGLFGAADPKRTGPIGSGSIVIQANLPCVPCRKRHCKNSKRLCMESIEPERAASKVLEAFSCNKT